MAKSLIIVTFFIVTFFVLCPSFTLAYCPKGTFMFKPTWGTEVCDDCPRGTFMPHDNHTNRRCFQCTEIVNNTLEIQIEACDRTQDSIIHCVPGYYRRRPVNVRQKERCEKCTVCADSHQTEPCKTYTDTNCCQEQHYVVSPNHDGVDLCWETPWMCREGQYFDTYYYSCEPCPDGTFMDSDYHIMTKCSPCPTVSEIYHLPKHAIMVSPCNKTHPPIIECQAGFFIQYGLGFNNENIGCSKCKKCKETVGQYDGRRCGRFHDTVCCPQPNMTVSDTTDGPKCHDTVSEGKSLMGTQGNNTSLQDSVNATKFTHRQQMSENNKNLLEDKNELNDISGDSNFEEDSKGLSPGVTVSIVLSLLFIIVIAMVIFVVIRYRPWPFKTRNCNDPSTRRENHMEVGLEMSERLPLLEYTGGQQPETLREIIIRDFHKISRDPPQRIYLPFFELPGPNQHTLEGCVTVMKDGDLSFYIALDGDDERDRPMLTIWQVLALGEPVRKTMSLDKFISPEGDIELNDNNSLIIKNDQLRDKGFQLPDAIRVKWAVTMEAGGQDGHKKLLVECKVSPL